MADKTIIINAVTVAHGQGVKESMESKSDTIVCFDESIPQGSQTVSYTVTVDRLVYETKEDYEKIRDMLKDMLSTPGDLTTREVIRFPKEKPFVIVKNYSNVVFDSSDYEMKPEEHSAQNLKFTCGYMEEYTEDYTGE